MKSSREDVDGSRSQAGRVLHAERLCELFASRDVLPELSGELV